MLDTSLTRRAMLSGTAALSFASGCTRAEDQIFVGAPGGDYANLLRGNVDDQFKALQGIKVVQNLGDDDPRMAKMFVERRLPRGTNDVVCLQAVRAHEAERSNLLEPLDTTKVPNISHVLPNLRTGFYAPQFYSMQVLIYNPYVIKGPPKTFTDLLDAKYKGRVGIVDGDHFYVMMSAALAATGDLTRVNSEKTRALAMKLNSNGLRLYPSTDSLGAGIKSGEIDVGIMWQARVIMWQNAGIPVKASFQNEGSVLYVWGMAVPRNAPNKSLAYKYLNAMLAPPTQRSFADKMGYLPAVDNAPLTGKLGDQLALPNRMPNLITPNYDVVGPLQGPTSEWWTKNIQRTR